MRMHAAVVQWYMSVFFKTGWPAPGAPRMVQVWDGALPVLLGVATDMTPGVYNFATSASAAGWAPVLLGLGEPWAGFRTKMSCYRAACAALPPGTLVVCADTSDVLLQGSPDDVAAAWRTSFLGMRVVFGVEDYCAGNCEAVPSLWRAQWGVDAATWPAARYINSGIVIGTARELAAMWTWMLAHGATDDQLGASAYVNAVGPVGFALDAGRLLAQNYVWGVHGEDPSPAPILHFPGFLVTSAWRAEPTKYAHTTRRLLGASAMPIGIGKEFSKTVLPMLALSMLLSAAFGVALLPGFACVNAFALACLGASLIVVVIRRQSVNRG